MSKLLGALVSWLQRRHEKRLLRSYGGIQWCPWCRQCAQFGDGWHFDEWERDPFLDVLTCGVCGGTSLWKFEIGMIFIGSLEPPKPAFQNTPYYDVEAAALRACAAKEQAND